MGNWQLDPYHTQVEFSAKHLAMMTVRGYFDELSASADIDPEHPETASVEVTISTASVRTNNGIRDNDLRSSNFLEVEKYPEIKFKSTSVEPSGVARLPAATPSVEPATPKRVLPPAYTSTQALAQ